LVVEALKGDGILKQFYLMCYPVQSMLKKCIYFLLVEKIISAVIFHSFMMSFW